MKKIKQLFFTGLLIFIILQVSNAKDLNLSYFQGYFLSNDYNKHLEGLIDIQKNKDSLQNNQDLINLLINEIVESQAKSLNFLHANDEKFHKLLTTSVETLGYVGTTNEIKFIFEIMLKEQNEDVYKAGFFAAGLIEENDKYVISISIVKFFKNFDYTSIGDNDELCFTIVETICGIIETKPIDIVDHIGLLSVFKSFTDKSTFPPDVADYSKRKLLDIMIRQM